MTLPTLDAARLGERGDSAARFVRAWRRAAWAGSLVLLWGLVGALGWVLGGVDAAPFVLASVAGAAALAGVGLALARVQRAAQAFLTLALAAAAAGHLLHPRGEPLRVLFPAAWWGVALVLAALLVAPLVAGWRAHAVVLALRSTGRLPRALPLRALDAEDGADLLAPMRAPWLGLLRRLGEGYLLPGAAAMDAAGRLARRGEVMHGALDAEAARAALVEAGHAVEPRGAGLAVTLAEGGSVLVRPVPLLLSPRGGVALHGAPEARRAVRRALETAGVRMCWTDAGRRFEARLDRLLDEAAQASSLEERSALYEEAQRVESVLDQRDLLHDDWVVLRAWKAHRLRSLLAHKLLGEPVGPRAEGRVLAPAPALRPDLARVLDAGGLATLPRVVFVPHWVVPVRTRWGEAEVLVNALTGKPHPDGPALLDAARQQGAGLLLAAPRGVKFLPAPEPTAALLRDLRDALPPGVDVSRAAEAPIEWLLVPHLPTAEGYVDAVTGAPAADLGPVPGVAAA